jgi:hypothetical protein
MVLLAPDRNGLSFFCNCLPDYHIAQIQTMTTAHGCELLRVQQPVCADRLSLPGGP